MSGIFLQILARQAHCASSSIGSNPVALQRTVAEFWSDCLYGLPAWIAMSEKEHAIS